MNEPTAALLQEPFDQISCDDVRVRWLYSPADAAVPVADLSIAQAVAGQVGPFADPAWEHVVPPLTRWAHRTRSASLDELAAELLMLWESLRPSIRQLRQQPVTRRRKLRAWDEPTRRAVRARLMASTFPAAGSA